jgi:hypothetical protein
MHYWYIDILSFVAKTKSSATGQHNLFVIKLIVEHSNAEWIDPASIQYSVVFVGVTLQS